MRHRYLFPFAIAGLLLVGLVGCEGEESPAPSGEGYVGGGGHGADDGAGGTGGKGGSAGTGGGDAPCTLEDYENPACIACAREVVAICMAAATAHCPGQVEAVVLCSVQNGCGAPLDPDFDEMCLLENCLEPVIELFSCTVEHCEGAPICFDLG